MAIIMAMAAIATLSGDCDRPTTPQVEACLTSKFQQADATRNRYYQAALTQGQHSNGSEAVNGIKRAEQAWLAYRNAACSAVYDRYGGTIRTSKLLECRIRLTRLHSYVLWRNWLTYPDSTPPMLPRPTIEEALSDGHG